MKFSPKLLGKNEHVIPSCAHIKALIPNIVANIVIVVVAVLAFVYLPLDWRPTSGWVILAVTITLVLIFGVWPWLNWLTSTYTVTNRRLITRIGALQNGVYYPLTRISDVSYEHSLLTACLAAALSSFRHRPRTRSTSMTFPRWRRFMSC